METSNLLQQLTLQGIDTLEDIIRKASVMPEQRGELEDALRHIRTINALKKNHNYTGLLIYAHEKFVPNPYCISYIATIVQALEQSENRGAVRHAWNNQGPTLLKVTEMVKDTTLDHVNLLRETIHPTRKHALASLASYPDLCRRSRAKSGQ